eukprot:5638868-Amphidinium_carterae.2
MSPSTPNNKRFSQDDWYLLMPTSRTHMYLRSTVYKKLLLRHRLCSCTHSHDPLVSTSHMCPTWAISNHANVRCGWYPRIPRTALKVSVTKLHSSH